MGVDNNQVFIIYPNYQTQVLIGCIEINPREQFYLRRDNDNLEIQFGDPLPGKSIHAMQGLVIIYNGMFNAVFGNDILMRNIKASYRDFYLRKEDYKEPAQNQILRYIRFAQIIRGISDGYRSMDMTLRAFHVLGLGAPVLIPVLVAAMDAETKLSIDSTSPIYIAVRQDTLFDPEKDADRVSCIKIVERIVNGDDWPFLCPFCQNSREVYSHKPIEAQKWWIQAKKPNIKKKHLKPKKILSRLLPLFGNNKDSVEADYCRIAHNHWVIDKFIHQVPDGSERKKWSRKKISKMLSYESTLTARGLQAANQILFEKS